MLAAELLKATQALVENIQGGAITETDTFIVTESDAWNCGNLIAGEELITKVERFEAHLTRVNEEIESAFWLNHTDVRNLFKAAKDKLTLHIIFTTEIFNETLISLESGQCTVLRKGGRIGNTVTLNVVNRGGNRFGSRGITVRHPVME